MKDFVKRHRKWSEDRNQSFLSEEILCCMEQAKKRLSVNVHAKAIYADVDPEHFVEDLLAEFLAKQFPEYLVVLESPRGTFASGKNVAGVVKTRKNMQHLVKELH